MVAALLSTAALSACNSPPPPLQAAVYAGPNTDRKLGPVERDLTSNSGGSTGAVANVTTAAQAPAGPVPRFDVVAQRTNDRPDDMTTYYVVIDPVDSSYDGFKLAVKNVLIVLRDNNGGPVFSARIWDHLPAAQTEVSFRSNPDLFSEDMMSAKASFNGQHLVANYVGGMASVDEPPTYVLFWYPEVGIEARPTNQWMSAELWKP
jgi:hypothetical protein